MSTQAELFARLIATIDTHLAANPADAEKKYLLSIQGNYPKELTVAEIMEHLRTAGSYMKSGYQQAHWVMHWDEPASYGGEGSWSGGHYIRGQSIVDVIFYDFGLWTWGYTENDFEQIGLMRIIGAQKWSNLALYLGDMPKIRKIAGLRDAA